MSDEQKARESEVFDQEVSVEDLDAASGGGAGMDDAIMDAAEENYGGPDKLQSDNCTQRHHRPLYGGGGFPNCAATVEDGSWCGRNDACYDDAVRYDGRVDCAKAWR